MREYKQRVLFVGMLILGLIAPLIVLLPVPLLPESVQTQLNSPLGIVLVLLALASPLVFLYFAARAAVIGRISGVLVLGSWWLVSVLGALLNWGSGQPANAIAGGPDEGSVLQGD